MAAITEAPETGMPQPLRITPLVMLRLDHALTVGRIRRIEVRRSFIGLTLNDGTVLKLTSEEMAIAVIRAMASAANRGMTPRETTQAERLSFGRVTADDTEGHT